MQKAILEGRYSLPSRYEDLILLEARRSRASYLENLQDFTEGLHNKWLEAASQRTWEEAREIIKSKRYSYARLDRMAAYSLLDISKDLFQEAKDKGPSYARLLAFNDRGRQWLRQQDAQVPIIKKWAPFYKEAQGLTKESLRLDALATDIQALSFANPDQRQGHTDYTYSPVFVRDEMES